MLIYIAPLIVAILAEREHQHIAEIESAHARLRRHATTVEQLAISRERNRLARDLHDTLAHSLAALTVQLKALRTLWVHDPAAVENAVNEALVVAQNGLEESRQAIHALRADPLTTLGLVGAMKSMLQSFQTRAGISSDINVAGEEPDLSPEEARTLFRIAEEALTNVERHALAQQVHVYLASGLDRIDLTIRDDGIGFDPAEVSEDRYGLIGMQERAAVVGATLHVQSSPGGGTEVWCSLKR